MYTGNRRRTLVVTLMLLICNGVTNMITKCTVNIRTFKPSEYKLHVFTKLRFKKYNSKIRVTRRQM